jgi:hypothetical protein
MFLVAANSAFVELSLSAIEALKAKGRSSKSLLAQV